MLLNNTSLASHGIIYFLHISHNFPSTGAA